VTSKLLPKLLAIISFDNMPDLQNPCSFWHSTFFRALQALSSMHGGWSIWMQGLKSKGHFSIPSSHSGDRIMLTGVICDIGGLGGDIPDGGGKGSRGSLSVKAVKITGPK